MGLLDFMLGQMSASSSGGSTVLPLHFSIGRYDGDAAANPDYNRYVSGSGMAGKYLLIAVMHRYNLVSIPTGAELLDKTTLVSGSDEQYMSVFKYYVSTNNYFNLPFGAWNGNTTYRLALSWWVLDKDFTLVKKTTQEFQYYLEQCQLETTDLTFFTFSAYTAQNLSTGAKLTAVCNNAFVNQPYPLGYQLRHFSGIIPKSDETITSYICEEWDQSTPLTVESIAQVVSYSVTLNDE